MTGRVSWALPFGSITGRRGRQEEDGGKRRGEEGGCGWWGGWRDGERG